MNDFDYKTNDRIRLTFSKKGLLKYVSHKDMMKILFRSIRRSGLPVAFSQGFSPHYKVSFSEPVKVGIQSNQEYVDLFLHKQTKTAEIKKALNTVMPKGLTVLSAKSVNIAEPSLVKAIRNLEYLLEIPDDLKIAHEEIIRFLRFPMLEVVIEKKERKKTINIAEWLETVSVIDKGRKNYIRLVMRPVLGNFISPTYFIALLQEKYGALYSWKIIKNQTRLLNDN
ncbi:TIGR03936 family radical SAM-associated protein [Chlamydiota bacterium]